jgi:predicted enzyme related to lactoylglutathione lyase
MAARLLGLRTTIYKVSDLAKAKEWYSKTFGIAPYFDEPYYVGFNVGGFELGLDPDISSTKPGPGGAVTYWGVEDLSATMNVLEGLQVKLLTPPQDVGEGIKVGSVADPFGNVVGLIENPKFGKGASLGVARQWIGGLPALIRRLSLSKRAGWNEIEFSLQHHGVRDTRAADPPVDEVGQTRRGDDDSEARRYRPAGVACIVRRAGGVCVDPRAKV